MQSFEEYLAENLDPIDQDAYYEEMLDCEGTVTVGGLEFYPSRILKELDPIAYNCGKLDLFGTSDFQEYEGEYYDNEEYDRVLDDYRDEVQNAIDEALEKSTSLDPVEDKVHIDEIDREVQRLSQLLQ